MAKVIQLMLPSMSPLILPHVLLLDCPCSLAPSVLVPVSKLFTVETILFKQTFVAYKLIYLDKVKLSTISTTNAALNVLLLGGFEGSRLGF